MYIKNIELKNFQKHKLLRLEFCDTVNVIAGKTDSGKSSVIRALQWVMYNDPQGECVRRVGTKETSVTIELDSGVLVRRIRSDSANAYSIVRNEVECQYDAIGRGNVPDDVERLLGCHAVVVGKEKIFLNISQQFDSSFLLSWPATQRARMLNAVTKCDCIDSAIQSFNKDVSSYRRDIKIYDSNIERYVQKKNDIDDSLFCKRLIRDKLCDLRKQFSNLFLEYKKIIVLVKEKDDIKQKLEYVCCDLEKSSVSIDIESLEGQMKSVGVIDDIFNKQCFCANQLLETHCALKEVSNLLKTLFDEMKLLLLSYGKCFVCGSIFDSNSVDGFVVDRHLGVLID